MINSNIYHYFDTIITSESVGVKKPNPKVFNYALKQANAKKEHSIMIGDNVEADIRGALKVGMKAIHCNFENAIIRSEEFVSVTCLSAIKKYI
jgi:putative hydrolase of the HAD superfamily